MLYVAKLKDQVFKTVSIKDNAYKLDANEIELTRRAYITLSDALNEGYTIRVNDNVESISSLSDVTVTKDDKAALYPVYICGYQDDGANIRLIEPRIVNNNEEFNTDIFIPVTHVVYDALNNYRDVMRLGNILSAKTEGVISLDDIRIQSINQTSEEVVSEKIAKATVSIDNYRKVISLKALDLLATRFDFRILLDFYRFIVLNNKLISQGYVITEENREDKYIEIVNKDDEALLDDLSDYLKSMDSISQYNYQYGMYKQLMIDVDKASTIEDIDDKFREFSAFFSR